MTQDISLKDITDKMANFLAERDWGKFHDPKNLAMSIAIEAGELLELFQWQTNREINDAMGDSEKLSHVKEELADVMLYCLDMARLFKIDVLEALWDKIEVNAKRYPASRFRGVAKKYDNPL